MAPAAVVTTLLQGMPTTYTASTRILFIRADVCDAPILDATRAPVEVGLQQWQIFTRPASAFAGTQKVVLECKFLPFGHRTQPDSQLNSYRNFVRRVANVVSRDVMSRSWGGCGICQEDGHICLRRQGMTLFAHVSRLVFVLLNSPSDSGSCPGLTVPGHTSP